MSYANGLGNLQNLLGTVAATETKRSDQTASAVDTATKVDADQTRFSSTSGLLGQSLNGPDARMPKVVALSAAISAGAYQVSSSDVAGKMIDALLS